MGRAVVLAGPAAGTLHRRKAIWRPDPCLWLLGSLSFCLCFDFWFLVVAAPNCRLRITVYCRFAYYFVFCFRSLLCGWFVVIVDRLRRLHKHKHKHKHFTFISSQNPNPHPNHLYTHTDVTAGTSTKENPLAPSRSLSLPGWLRLSLAHSHSAFPEFSFTILQFSHWIGLRTGDTQTAGGGRVAGRTVRHQNTPPLDTSQRPAHAHVHTQRTHSASSPQNSNYNPKRSRRT